MEHFRSILAALDLGPNGDGITPGSRKAMDRAVWIARRLKAPLTLLHSGKADEYWDPEAGTYVAGGSWPGDPERIVEEVVSELREQHVDVHFVVRPESALLAIIHEVQNQKIDLVVAGKRTGPYSDDRKLGTVARKLLRKCPSAVWLEDWRQTSDPSLILAATDLTPVGDRAVELAGSVANAFGAELHVVHAFSLSMEAQHEGGKVRETYLQKQRETALSHIEGLLASIPKSVTVETHVGLTSPTQAILECVDRLNPGLVVMGTVSRGGIAGVLMGNTAERLIDRIDCPLLTIKPDDFVCPVNSETEGSGD